MTRGAPLATGDHAELTRTVAPRDIELFTEISGDRNPLHYDEAAARASRFGEIVVQGGITSAILNAVVAEELPGPGTVFLNVNWDFKAPVRPGDTITCTGTVVSKYEKDGLHLVDCEIAAENQQGEKCAIGNATVALPKRS